MTEFVVCAIALEQRGRLFSINIKHAFVMKRQSVGKFRIDVNVGVSFFELRNSAMVSTKAIFHLTELDTELKMLILRKLSASQSLRLLFDPSF